MAIVETTFVTKAILFVVGAVIAIVLSIILGVFSSMFGIYKLLCMIAFIALCIFLLIALVKRFTQVASHVAYIGDQFVGGEGAVSEVVSNGISEITSGLSYIRAGFVFGIILLLAVLNIVEFFSVLTNNIPPMCHTSEDSTSSEDLTYSVPVYKLYAKSNGNSTDSHSYITKFMHPDLESTYTDYIREKDDDKYIVFRVTENTLRRPQNRQNGIIKAYQNNTPTTVPKETTVPKADLIENIGQKNELIEIEIGQPKLDRLYQAYILNVLANKRRHSESLREDLGDTDNNAHGESLKEILDVVDYGKKDIYENLNNVFKEAIKLKTMEAPDTETVFEFELDTNPTTSGNNQDNFLSGEANISLKNNWDKFQMALKAYVNNDSDSNQCFKDNIYDCVDQVLMEKGNRFANMNAFLPKQGLLWTYQPTYNNPMYPNYSTAEYRLQDTFYTYTLLVGADGSISKKNYEAYGSNYYKEKLKWEPGTTTLLYDFTDYAYITNIFRFLGGYHTIFNLPIKSTQTYSSLLPEFGLTTTPSFPSGKKFHAEFCVYNPDESFIGNNASCKGLSTSPLIGVSINNYTPVNLCEGDVGGLCLSTGTLTRDERLFNLRHYDIENAQYILNMVNPVLNAVDPNQLFTYNTTGHDSAFTYDEDLKKHRDRGVHAAIDTTKKMEYEFKIEVNYGEDTYKNEEMNIMYSYRHHTFHDDFRNQHPHDISYLKYRLQIDIPDRILEPALFMENQDRYMLPAHLGGMTQNEYNKQYNNIKNINDPQWHALGRGMILEYKFQDNNNDDSVVEINLNNLSISVPGSSNSYKKYKGLELKIEKDNTLGSVNTYTNILKYNNTLKLKFDSKEDRIGNALNINTIALRRSIDEFNEGFKVKVIEHSVNGTFNNSMHDKVFAVGNGCFNPDSNDEVKYKYVNEEHDSAYDQYQKDFAPYCIVSYALNYDDMEVLLNGSNLVGASEVSLNLTDNHKIDIKYNISTAALHRYINNELGITGITGITNGKISSYINTYQGVEKIHELLQGDNGDLEVSTEYSDSVGGYIPSSKVYVLEEEDGESEYSFGVSDANVILNNQMPDNIDNMESNSKDFMLLYHYKGDDTFEDDDLKCSLLSPFTKGYFRIYYDDYSGNNIKKLRMKVVSITQDSNQATQDSNQANYHPKNITSCANIHPAENIYEANNEIYKKSLGYIKFNPILSKVPDQDDPNCYLDSFIDKLGDFTKALHKGSQDVVQMLITNSKSYREILQILLIMGIVTYGFLFLLGLTQRSLQGVVQTCILLSFLIICLHDSAFIASKSVYEFIIYFVQSAEVSLYNYLEIHTNTEFNGDNLLVEHPNPLRTLLNEFKNSVSPSLLIFFVMNLIEFPFGTITSVMGVYSFFWIVDGIIAFLLMYSVQQVGVYIIATFFPIALMMCAFKTSIKPLKDVIENMISLIFQVFVAYVMIHFFLHIASGLFEALYLGSCFMDITVTPLGKAKIFGVEFDVYGSHSIVTPIIMLLLFIVVIVLFVVLSIYATPAIAVYVTSIIIYSCIALVSIWLLFFLAMNYVYLVPYVILMFVAYQMSTVTNITGMIARVVFNEKKRESANLQTATDRVNTSKIRDSVLKKSQNEGEQAVQTGYSTVMEHGSTSKS